MVDQEKSVYLWETDNGEFHVLVAVSFAESGAIFLVCIHYGGMVELVKRPLVWKNVV